MSDYHQLQVICQKKNNVNRELSLKNIVINWISLAFVTSSYTAKKTVNI